MTTRPTRPQPMTMAPSVADIIRHGARRYGAKTALVFEDQRWSFEQIDVASDLVAGNLVKLGVQTGDVVSLFSPNCPEWIVAYYAVLKIGAVVNPLNLMLTPDEVAYAVSDCASVAIIGSADRIASLEGMRASTKLRHCIAYGSETPSFAVDFQTLLALGSPPPMIVEPDPTAPSTIAYTSGTTGHPKGAVLSHRSVLMNTAMTATMHLRGPQDTVVSALPCSHVYGNIVMNAAIAYGMTLVLHANFDVERVLASIEQHRATMLEGVPTMYMYLLNSPRLQDFDLSSLTRCTVGGQTMPEAKMRQVEAALGCPLIELWGMTELGGLGSTHSVYGPKQLGSIGIALPHLEARIGAADGTEAVLPPGEVGELQIRGPMVMDSYLGRPDATAQAIDAQGWLRTGDLARIDDEGYLYIVDRLNDMIITAGFNIYPAELERVIAEHPDVAMVAVASIPDEYKGELAKAYIVPRDGSSPDAAELEAFCRARLAAYKVPRAFQFVADLPKTSSGKVLRRKLREIDAAVATPVA